MPSNHPIVRLTRASVGERVKGRKARFPPKIPYDRQAQLLGQVFAKAASSLKDLEKGVDVASDPRAVVPERCLVFELIGPVQEFNLAAQALGLDWMASDVATDSEDDEDDGGDEPGSTGGNLLYFTMPTERALKRLLRQWNLYSKGNTPEPEFKVLWQIFGYLHDLRTWSIEDRLDPQLKKYVAAMLKSRTDVAIELNLWYRTERERRDGSLETVRELVNAVGGELLDEVDIPEIRYQGALIRVSGQIARQLVKGEGAIARLNDVMTIRPQSAYASRLDSVSSAPSRFPQPPAALRPCVAALLDGYPIENHAALTGRLHVVEVDVEGLQVPVNGRVHGTAMASLVVHGDLDSLDEDPLDRMVTVIPVLAPSADGTQETTPEGKLPIAVMHRALQAIVNADPDEDPDLADVVVINHSLCDDHAPFTRRLSPWASLLDYYAHAHKLLFVVSAGNIFGHFPVPDYADIEDFEGDDPDDREHAILLALERAKGRRGLLSPAESINALTIGALHADDANIAGKPGINPYPNHRMTNLASAVGFGVNRSIKPDMVAFGGRYIANCSNDPDGSGVHVQAAPSVHYGQLVAAPSSGGNLSYAMRTAGTSNAAALMTRATHQVADAVEDFFDDLGEDWRDSPSRAVILKALLAHGCTWDAIGPFLELHYPPQGGKVWSRRRDSITKFLGYGRPTMERVVSGDENRITLLAYDSVKADDRHVYQLPITAAILNTKEVRAITLTLAWTTPTTHTNIDPRAVTLALTDSTGKADFWGGVQRTNIIQPNGSTSRRGTLVHMRLEGEKRVKGATTTAAVGVQAMSKKGFEKTAVPYALAVTIEIGVEQRTELYAEVREAIRARARTRQLR